MDAELQEVTAPEMDRSASFERANVIALLMIPVIALLVFPPFLLLHGAKAFAAGWLWITSLRVWLPGLVITVIVHELLHGIGFRLAGGPPSAVQFGFHWKSFTPYAACRVPLPVQGYRFAAALPAIVLGVLPALAALITGTGWMIVMAFWMLAFASGDMLILWLVRDLPRGTMVIDHPERAGCRIVGGLTS